MVRLYLTNTANTRVFKVALPGARMKLVGGDSGRAEHEELVDEVVIAPSERLVVDVLFEQPGELTLEHRTPERIYPLAAVSVAEEAAEPALEQAVRGAAHQPRDGRGARARSPRTSTPIPTRRIAFIAEMDMDAPEGEGHHLHLPDAPRGRERRAGPLPGVRHEAASVETATYTCPMHPEW